MSTTYIITSQYMDGTTYADKFTSLDEVIDMLNFINSDENGGSVPENSISPDHISLTTDSDEED